MATEILDACGGVNGNTVFILGLTYKPNTDEMRDAPSLDIIPALKSADVIIKAYDPKGMKDAEAELGNIVYCGRPYEI